MDHPHRRNADRPRRKSFTLLHEERGNCSCLRTQSWGELNYMLLSQRCTYIHACRHGDRRTGGQTDRQTDRQTNRQTDTANQPAIHPSIHPSNHASIHACMHAYIHTYTVIWYCTYLEVKSPGSFCLQFWSVQHVVNMTCPGHQPCREDPAIQDAIEFITASQELKMKR